MAATQHIINPVIEAHSLKVNGISSYGPDLDDARAILEQVHALLLCATAANEQKDLPDEIIQEAFSGVGSLLELGIRNLAVGHEALLQESRH